MKVEEMEMMVSNIANSIAATTGSSCKNTIVITTFVVFAIRLCSTKLFWPNNRGIPAFTFRQKRFKKKDTPYCVVCLHEAEEGERFRRLPKCNHCFHVVCIDAWFLSHSTCPLCRRTVFLPHDAPPPTLLRHLRSYFLLLLRVSFKRLCESLVSSSSDHDLTYNNIPS